MKRMLEPLEIPIPPLDQQRGIAHVLFTLILGFESQSGLRAARETYPSPRSGWAVLQSGPVGCRDAGAPRSSRTGADARTG